MTDRDKLARELCNIHWGRDVFDGLNKNIKEEPWLSSAEYKDFWLNLADHVLKREKNLHCEALINLDPYFETTTLYRKVKNYHEGCIAELEKQLGVEDGKN